MSILKIGDRIKVADNHMYSGHGGIVEDVNTAYQNYIPYSHIIAKLDSGETIFLRPEQYEIVQ